MTLRRDLRKDLPAINNAGLSQPLPTLRIIIHSYTDLDVISRSFTQAIV